MTTANETHENPYAEIGERLANALQDARAKTLMKRILDDLEELKGLNEDYWRLIMIAMMQEEKKLSNAKLEKIQETAPVENEEVEEEESPYNASTIQEKILMMVHDAIYMTVKETGKYDPIAVRNWFGYSKDVRGIIKSMPEDEFNAAFGKMAEAIIKEINEETEE